MDFLLVIIELFSLGVTADALRANIDRKLAISLLCGQFDPTFQAIGVAPPIIFARIVSLATLSLTVYTHTRYSVADFLQARCDFRHKNCVFEPLWRGSYGQRMVIILGSLESA